MRVGIFPVKKKAESRTGRVNLMFFFAIEEDENRVK